MNRHKFERWLRQHKCVLARHGGGHDIWANAGHPIGVPVPRHNEVKSVIVKKVCISLDIPVPSEK